MQSVLVDHTFDDRDFQHASDTRKVLAVGLENGIESGVENCRYCVDNLAAQGQLDVRPADEIAPPQLRMPGR